MSAYHHRTMEWALFLYFICALALPPGLSGGSADGPLVDHTSLRHLHLAKRTQTLRGGHRVSHRPHPPQRRRTIPKAASEQVWMTEEEQMEIMDHLQPHHIMLEWGSGGSTVHFSRYVKEYYSVEHSQAWHEGISRVVRSLGNVWYVLAAVSPGYRGWTGGLQPGNYDQFRRYVHAPERRFKPVQFDRVLVDGRARVACAVSALRFIGPKSLVFIHDYTLREEERHYSQVLRYYDVVAQAGTLIVLRPKRDAVGMVANETLLNGLYAWQPDPHMRLAIARWFPLVVCLAVSVGLVVMVVWIALKRRQKSLKSSL